MIVRTGIDGMEWLDCVVTDELELALHIRWQ